MKMITKFIDNGLGQYEGYPRKVLKCKIPDYIEEVLKDQLKNKDISLKQYYNEVIKLADEIE